MSADDDLSVITLIRARCAVSRKEARDSTAAVAASQHFESI